MKDKTVICLCGCKKSRPAFDKQKRKRKFIFGHMVFKNGHSGIATKGESNWRWRGDSIGYKPLHSWIKYHFGKPSFCEHCKTTTAKWFHSASRDGKTYTRKRSDWLRICQSCHFRMDKIGTKAWVTRWKKEALAR